MSLLFGYKVNKQEEKTMRRKHILLKNEIDMLQKILREEVFPTEEYRLKLEVRLEKLKKEWYK